MTERAESVVPSPWGAESFEPWIGQRISEDATVYLDMGERERALRGRVNRDEDGWVHVQTDTQRLSIPAHRVNAIEWDKR